LLAFDDGVLSATTAFGKTVVAAWLIAKRRVNTLIVVHRAQLLEQWVERLKSFLELPEAAIGTIGGGRKKPTGLLDVAVMQSERGSRLAGWRAASGRPGLEKRLRGQRPKTCP
jgi:superfamily II DNA or RNA helicase